MNDPDRTPAAKVCPQVSSFDRAMPISPTLHLSTFVEVQMQYPNQHFAILHVESNSTYEAILQVWNFRFQPAVVSQQSDEPIRNGVPVDANGPHVAITKFELADCIHAPFEMLPKLLSITEQVHALEAFQTVPALLADASSGVRLFALTTDVSVNLNALAEVPHVYDVLGNPRDQIYPSELELFFTEQIGDIPGEEWQVLAKGIPKFTLEFRIPANTDNLVWVITGTNAAGMHFVKLLQRVLTVPWMNLHGRELMIQQAEETKWIVIFSPLQASFAAPAEVMNRHASLKLTQAVLKSYETQESSGVLVSMRFLQFKIMQGYYHAEQKLEPMLDDLQLVMTPMLCKEAPRIIAYGCSWKHNATFADMAQKKRSKDGNIKPVSCYLRPALTGGGSKQDHLHALHAGLSSLAMSYGAKVQDTPQIVQKLMQELGVPRVHHLLYVEAPDRREQQFLVLCQECQITLPSNKPIVQQVEARIHRAKRIRQHQELKDLDLSRYTLEPGYFRLPNQEPAPILARLASHHSGVHLMPPAELQPWIVTKQRISPDPLAVFVVGAMDESMEQQVIQCFDASKALAPAIDDADRKVLLAGMLVQLGESSIATPADESPAIPTQPAQVIAITMWSDEFPPETWQQVTSQPVKSAKKILEAESLQLSIRSPWGRTFRKQKQPCSPPESTSVQFHCEVDLTCLPQLLKASGLLQLYVTAKDASGKPDARWKVVWIEVDRKKLPALAGTIPGYAGLVRNDSSLGIRAEVASLSKAWPLLKPGVPMPDVTIMQMLWKVAPFPLGVTKDVIVLWGNAINWHVKPLKSLKKQQWLIASDSPPPQKVLCFNGSPLILQKVDQRPFRAQIPLVAGPMLNPDSKRKNERSSEPPSATIFRTGDPFLDPWAMAKQITPANTADGVNHHAGSIAAEGPIQKQLDAQDAKILALEKKMHDLHVQTTEQHEGTSRKLAALDQGIQQHANQTQQAFQEFQSTLQQSLASAMSKQMHETMSQQEDRIAANLARVVAELQVSRQPPKKRAAEGDAQSTESEDMGIPEFMS